MSIVKASELAYCRLQVPDLGVSDQFAVDFGLVPAEQLGARRYYRGTDPAPYCYVLEEGPAHFLGFAFNAKTREDLDRLAEATGAQVEPIEAPGGGWRVRVKEPNGYDVDLVWGIEKAAPIEAPRQDNNTARRPLARAGELMRLPRGKPTPVRRLAHVVLGTPKVRETIDWFHAILGMISSDEVTAGPDKTLIGAFIRVDDGQAYVDHHAVFVIRNPTAGLHHLSFESQDIDAVLHDHHMLLELGRYEHYWGVGRHLLGSQIFDYWSDPLGFAHEHWADTDRLNAEAATNHWDAREGMITQWGDEPPEKFRACVRP